MSVYPAFASLLIEIFVGNILILRGDIEILPETRTSVSYEFLSQLVGEYLLTSRPDIDVSAAFSIMPHTQSQSSSSLASTTHLSYQ